MDTIKSPTPEQIQKLSENFSEYCSQLKHLENSLTEDMDVMFPPFTGHHPEKEELGYVVSALQHCTQILEKFSLNVKIMSELLEEDKAAESVMMHRY